MVTLRPEVTTRQLSERRSVDPLRPAYWLSGAIAVLLVVAAVPGVFVSGLYHDTAKIVATDRGSDLVTLVLIAPALVISLLLSIRGSVPAKLVWLGLLGWTVYNYGVYAAGLRFTPLFLVHVALLSLAAFALVSVVRRLDLARIRSEVAPASATRYLSVFLLVVAALFLVLWLSDVLPATLNGTTPERLKELQTTSNAVEIMDLAFVIPLLVAAGITLWRRRAVGYVLGGAMLTLSTAVMAAISPGGVIFGGLTPEPIYPTLALLSGIVTVVFLALVNRRQAFSRR